MTNRPTDLSSKNCCVQAESRLNQQIKRIPTDEGCPVIEESGTVCGEKDTLTIFQEFRKIYDDCLRKLEGSSDGNILLKKLAPFRKIVDDLWVQNNMLVETVEELEQEAACQVTNLQEKLNKSCQKIIEYKKDIESLIEIIHRLKNCGVFDSSGLQFYTINSSLVYGERKNSYSLGCEPINRNSLTEPCNNRDSCDIGNSIQLSSCPSTVSCCGCGCKEQIRREVSDRIAKPVHSKKSSKSSKIKVAEKTIRGKRKNDASQTACRQLPFIDEAVCKECSCSQSECQEDEDVFSESCSECDIKDCCDCECPYAEETLIEPELHCILKSKEREVECLNKELSEKDELLKDYCQHIEQLKSDIKEKNKKCKELITQLKCATQKELNKSGENNDGEFEDCDPTTALGELLNSYVTDLENQRNSIMQEAECQVQLLTAERKKMLAERNEVYNKLQYLTIENEKLVKELGRQKICDPEKEDLLKIVDQLKSEKNDLLKKISSLHENIQVLNTNFKETRWALTSEVAEKHDQVQELRKCLGILEEQLRQADKQSHFKDDVIKELRRDVKSSRKSMSNPDYSSKVPSREHSPPTQLINVKPINLSTSEKIVNDDELKLNIRIFPLNETDKKKGLLKNSEKHQNCQSVEVQTEFCCCSPLKTRNVSTQHNIRVQKLPRSFGTLTVTPWSGTGQAPTDDLRLDCLKETKKNLKGVYTVPFSSI